MLIQEIRARQAMEEVGMSGEVRVVHSEKPQTFINGKEYSLVFPKFILEAKENKVVDKLFIGLLTEQRKKFLSNFENAIIRDSDNGRHSGTKERDTLYFRLMSRARFVLCPNGDFIWTYRFFEAILCKAIPIIEEDCELYEGYHFYKLGDNYEYKETWVQENLSKIKREMML
jgi:hypothetical protein